MMTQRCVAAPTISHRVQALPRQTTTTEPGERTQSPRPDALTTYQTNVVPTKGPKRFRWKKVFQLRSPYDGKILDLAGPACLTLAADPLLSIVDTIYVGKLGATSLGALGVNTGVFTLAFLICNFLSISTTTLVSSALGGGDKDRAGRTTVQSFVVAAMLGIPLLAGLQFYADDVLHTMGVSADIFNSSKEYLLARSFAAPAVLLCLAGQGVFRGMQDTRTPLAITFGANLVNFILDPILIYKLHMGVEGAAIATATAEILSGLAYCVLLWRRRGDVGLDCSPMDIVKKTQGDYLPFVESSGAVVLRSGTILGLITLTSAVSARIGPVQIAAHQVLAQIWLLHSLVCDSLAIAGQTLIAAELAQKKSARKARRICERLIQLSILLGILNSFIGILGSQYLPLIFTKDPTVITAMNGVYPITIVMLPVIALACVFDGIITGAEDFGWLTQGMALSFTGAASMMLFLEPRGWGLIGVWLSHSSFYILRIAIFGYRWQQPKGPIPPVD